MTQASETCKALWTKLVSLVLPNSKNWEESGNNFRHKWNFPNCVGAIETCYGKHVVIQVSFNNYETQILVVILKAVTEI